MSFIQRLLHSHDWKIVYSSKWGTVHRCRSCTEQQTTLLDFTTGKPTTVPGNLLAALFSPVVFILCASQEEYTEAVRYYESNHKYPTSFEFLHREDQLAGRINPVIYLYGDWQENDLVGSAVLTKALNGWL